jgi:hypothetical protein
MIYTYTALDARGESKHGSMSADSEAAAIIWLRAQGLYPTQVKRVSAETTAPVETTKPAPRRRRRRTVTVPIPIIDLPKITRRDFFMMSVGALALIVILSLLYL